METMSLCPLCDEVEGRTTTPGGVIHDDGLWRVTHHPGPWVDPGELFVKVRRAAVAAVERVVRPERVYLAGYGERVRHVPFYVLARTASLPAGHVLSDVYRRGRGLLRRFGVAPNPSTSARAEAAGRIRDDEAWSRLTT